jgi:hypothetical protein
VKDEQEFFGKTKKEHFLVERTICVKARKLEVAHYDSKICK